MSNQFPSPPLEVSEKLKIYNLIKNNLLMPLIKSDKNSINNLHKPDVSHLISYEPLRQSPKILPNRRTQSVFF
jgi:hypothetical protein